MLPAPEYRRGMRGASPPRTRGRPSFHAMLRSSSLAHVHVTRPRNGLDDLRLCGITLDLLAQTRHANVDAAVEGLPVAPMRQIEELVAGQHLVGVSGEGMQQVKLHRGQAEFSAIPTNELVGIEIEQPAPEPEGVGRLFGPGAAAIRIGA